MRLLQSGKHMGKVVITAAKGDIVQVCIGSITSNARADESPS